MVNATYLVTVQVTDNDRDLIDNGIIPAAIKARFAGTAVTVTRLAVKS